MAADHDDNNGLSAKVTRRDFIGSTLIGTGAALLYAQCPAAAQAMGRSSEAWTGFGGVGDYRLANGNTWDVVTAAHRIRDNVYSNGETEIIDTGESYDVVIVGAGLAGLTAMYDFHKARPDGRSLMIDNHPIFGGYAKTNEFDVGGYRLKAPQASFNFWVPQVQSSGSAEFDKNRTAGAQYWRELKLPYQFDFADREDGDHKIAFSHGTSPAMYRDEGSATVGYYFSGRKGAAGKWAKDIWKDPTLESSFFPDSVKAELIKWRDSKTQFKSDAEEPRWLDSMSYGEFLTQVLKVGPEVVRYADPLVYQGLGASSDAVSAYGAQIFQLPGVARFPGRNPASGNTYYSFPGGNAVLVRHFVKAILPDALPGPPEFAAIANGAVNFSALDVSGSNRRMRFGATVVEVSHEGEPEKSEKVHIIYEKGGQLYRVTSRTAILAISNHVSKRILPGLPPDQAEALGSLSHGPSMMVTVALNNWRFLDKLGISAARWFEGFGFYGMIRQPMIVGEEHAPFHPDKPTVMILYIGFPKPGLPIPQQGAAGRWELFGTSYADYEKRILEQMWMMFGPAGFDARRDVAGIVLNRWGHAYVSPPPGFYFGTPEKPALRDRITRPFGRISFAYSGQVGWEGACANGKRSAEEIIKNI